MPQLNPYYLIWEGSLNLGDTTGVFMNSQFIGLILQLPISLTFVPSTLKEDISFLFMTNEVEIYNDKKHAMYWDWLPGQPLSQPVGFISDAEDIVDKPEYHVATIPNAQATEGMHTLTIIVNPEIPAGLKDDFVLKHIEADTRIGAKLGWGL